MAGDKAKVAEMTKFPLSMPYEVKAVKNKEDFLRRYNEIFKGEANAAQCFKSAEPDKESDRRYGIYCPFKDTPNDWENAPIRFIFELTKSGWKFVGLDNINEWSRAECELVPNDESRVLTTQPVKEQKTKK